VPLSRPTVAFGPSSIHQQRRYATTSLSNVRDSISATTLLRLGSHASCLPVFLSYRPVSSCYLPLHPRCSHLIGSKSLVFKYRITTMNRWARKLPSQPQSFPFPFHMPISKFLLCFVFAYLRLYLDSPTRPGARSPCWHFVCGLGVVHLHMVVIQSRSSLGEVLDGS
jgi:hypothetical protein